MCVSVAVAGAKSDIQLQLKLSGTALLQAQASVLSEFNGNAVGATFSERVCCDGSGKADVLDRDKE